MSSGFTKNTSATPRAEKRHSKHGKWQIIHQAFCCLLSVIHSQLWPLTEKAMAPQSSTLAWKIPWMEEPGGLQSMGSLRVRHDWVTSLWLFIFMHWRRKWQPTPVFLPGESQGWRSLLGCHLWGRTETDTTEATQQQQQQHGLSIAYTLPYFSGERP